MRHSRVGFRPSTVRKIDNTTPYNKIDAISMAHSTEPFLFV